jgi:hypothetical protein
MSLLQITLTRTSRAFPTYLEMEGIDAREAGNDANVALDRAGARCAELGAANVFPTDAQSD